MRPYDEARQRPDAMNESALLNAVGSWANQADFRCDLAAGFFAAVSFACFLPAIGISISFWSAAALRGFLVGFVVALGSAAAPPTLLRSASIRSTTFSPRGRSFGVIGF